MSTELDEAKLWYATAPDFDSYPEMLDAFHKHMLSLPQQDVGAGRSVPSEYVMSRDYSKLYDHLLKGGEALGWAKYKRIPSWWPQTIAVHVFMINKSSFIAKGTNEGLSFPTCESLIAACTRLNLEWLAVPSPVGQEPVAWMSEDGKSFVEAWAHDQWVSTGGPTAEFFLPRYPIPLVRLSPKP